VINLQKLLVREIAGQFSKGVYLISSNPYEPEMYELLFSTAKDQKIWIDQIRYAVENCPDEDEGVLNDCEEKKVEEARKAKIRELLNAMYEKDAIMAKICEDKMKIFAEMMVGYMLKLSLTFLNFIHFCSYRNFLVLNRSA